MGTYKYDMKVAIVTDFVWLPLNKVNLFSYVYAYKLILLKLNLKLPLCERMSSVSCRMPKLKMMKLVRHVMRAPSPLIFTLTASSCFKTPLAL